MPGWQLGDNNSLVTFQEKTYYPFGMTMTDVNNGDENKYQYNGKELVDDHSLHWYHYGARFYDPALGRWHSIDPADEFYSPYIYVGNNPILFIDPDGKECEVQIHHVVDQIAYHASIKITLDTPELITTLTDYIGENSIFSNVDDKGNPWATFGAGPIKGKLVSDFNRTRDVAMKKEEIIKLNFENKNELNFIKEIIEFEDNYKDNLDYDFFPAVMNGYNSNSTISGILLWGSEGPFYINPKLNSPGWEKPIPSSIFDYLKKRE